MPVQGLSELLNLRGPVRSRSVEYTTRPKRRPRDSQRSKLYSAETAVAASLKGRGMELPSAASVATVQEYVDRITQSAWWRDYGPKKRPHITVADGRGRSRAGSFNYRARITVPRHSRVRRVILHELAHQVTDGRHGPDTHAGHGPEFAGYFLSLVRRFLGEEAALKLRLSYQDKGVKYVAAKKGN
jgi:putative metallohydrolase (TIGR04338 family)